MACKSFVEVDPSLARVVGLTGDEVPRLECAFLDLFIFLVELFRVIDPIDQGGRTEDDFKSFLSVKSALELLDCFTIVWCLRSICLELTYIGHVLDRHGLLGFLLPAVNLVQHFRAHVREVANGVLVHLEVALIGRPTVIAKLEGFAVAYV